MHQAAVPVYADMRLIAEVPRVALLGLVCVRITLLVLVLGGRGRRNNRGVHHRSLLENQSAPHEHHDDLCEKLLLQAVLYQQIAEPPQRVAIGNLIARIHPAELRNGAAVNDLRYRAFVRQVVKVLQHIDAKHQFQIVGLVAALSFVIERLNACDPRSLRNDAVDLFQKLFFLRPHLRQFVGEGGQTQLFIYDGPLVKTTV